MKKIFVIVCSFFIAYYFIRQIFDKPAILIFSKTNGYHHSCIPIGIEAIKKLGEENGFSVDATNDSLSFTTNNLKKYAAFIFLCPTGKVFGPDQEAALQNYIEKGGGYVGIHSATDCEYNWPWYGKLAGAYFKSHPASAGSQTGHHQ